MQIRSNAESAAFYRCGSVEREKADTRLAKLVDTQQKLVLREYFLSCKLTEYFLSCKLTEYFLRCKFTIYFLSC